jgi:HK97 family phage major capsid protein
MFTKRAAGGSGTFDAGTPFSALPLTVWGVPTYRTRAMPAGSCLPADFDRGAMVVDREQVNVNTYNERYAEQNLVLLICEERVGLMIFRPDLFVNCSLP